MLALALTIALAAPVQEQAPGTPAAVRREWTIRAWALDPIAHRAALRSALADGRWQERAAALDALARHWASGGDALAFDGELAPFLEDPHPNVRALATRALAEHGPPAVLEDRVAWLLQRDVFPWVRLECARALQVVPSRAEVPVELELSADADERVRRIGRAAWFAADRAGTHGAPVLLRALGAGPEAWLDALEQVERAGARRTVRMARETLLAEPDVALHGGGERRYRARRALLEAVSFATTGEGDADALLEGWLGEGDWEPRRQALLATAARSGDVTLGRALLRALDAIERRVDEGSAGGDFELPWPGLAADLLATASEKGSAAVFHMRYELAEAAVACLGAEATLREADELDVGPGAIERILPVAVLTLAAWDVARTRTWLDADGRGRDERVRRACLDAFAGALSGRESIAGSGVLLSDLLDDPGEDIARAAFRALCEDPGPWVDPLHRAWLEEDKAERLERLAWLPRGIALEPFADDLITLGAHADRRRVVAAELLAATPLKRVHAALERWLLEDRAAFVAAADDERGELERRIKAEVRALSRSFPEESALAVSAALDAAIGRSIEVGKTAAWVLGRSEEGRQLLLRYLNRDVESRVRIEVGIALLPHTDVGLGWLMSDYARAAWDLRARILEAMGRAKDERSLALLRALAFGDEGEHAPDERVAAVAALVRRAPITAADVRGAPSFAIRRAAVRAMGAQGPDAVDRLRELWAEHEELARPGDERALLRAELLGAFARTGAFPGDLEHEWLAAPAARAADTLTRRHLDENVPKVSFSWPDELDVAVALGAAGTLGRALDASGAWTELDARLLVELAKRTPASDASWALARGGLIGLAGETDLDVKLATRVRCDLLGRAWAGERWVRFERLAVRLLADHVAGAVPASVWRDAFGDPDDPDQDPRARLTSAIWQARAHAALAAGEVERARACADEAEARLGRSRLARDEQRRLRELLSAGR